MPLCQHLYTLLHAAAAAAASTDTPDANLTRPELAAPGNGSAPGWQHGNGTGGLEGTVPQQQAEHVTWFLHEFRLIKVTVLVAVISILLLSTCRILLKTNASFPVVRKQDTLIIK
jgi:hypothetical protein